MDRRNFLKIGGGLILLSACRDAIKEQKLTTTSFPIQIDSNRNVGHLVRTAMELPIGRQEEIEVLIVGAGIAGLAAACSLPTENYAICELDPSLGGTSGAVNINGSLYSQGAHYDLAYPDYYGKDGLDLLKKLGIIEPTEDSNLWGFTDKQFLIPSEKEEACYYNGKKRASVLENNELKQNFLALIKEYEGRFPLPSTKIDERLHPLDQISFYDYLSKYLPVDDAFIESVDYQMLDDWGGTSRQVSALAGIHYYKCRPYYNNQEVELFSPPQGNYYFIQKMVEQLNREQIHTNHLVFGLAKQNDRWLVDVYDSKNKIRKQYSAEKVIYAGQKHALKFIHPESYEQFKDVRYAPWVVINFELKGGELKDSKWQNDFLSPDNAFLGFVDSSVQDKAKSRVLTAYYCFQEVQHYRVEHLEKDAKELVTECLKKMSAYYEKDVSPMVKKVHVKLLGHAMPIPQPNYITKKRVLVKDNLAFAGVDTGRFPLMFDALDSGIQAVRGL